MKEVVKVEKAALEDDSTDEDSDDSDVEIVIEVVDQPDEADVEDDFEADSSEEDAESEEDDIEQEEVEDDIENDSDDDVKVAEVTSGGIKVTKVKIPKAKKGEEVAAFIDKERGVVEIAKVPTKTVSKKKSSKTKLRSKK